MDRFEGELRSAFEKEFEKTPPTAALRERVIRRATGMARQPARGTAISRVLPAPRWRSQTRLVRWTAAGAAAAILLGAGGWYAASRLSAGGTVARVSPTATPISAPLAFGKLPPVSLQPASGLGGGGPSLSGPLPYYGPATLTWSGKFPKLPATAPVVRFAFPDAAAEKAFAQSIGAVPAAPGRGPSDQYTGPQDFMLSMGPDQGGLLMFFLNRDSGNPPPVQLTDQQAETAASQLLQALHIAPVWPRSISLSKFASQAGPIDTVQYQRLFEVSSTLQAGLVDFQGNPTGLQVQVVPGGRVVRVAGLLPATEASAAYPLEGQAAATKAALTPAPQQPSATFTPAVKLTQVKLAYAFVMRGSYGYFEPAYYFTGLFTAQGQQFEARVLVPAVAGAAIQP